MGATDSHDFKRSLSQLTLFDSFSNSNRTKIVTDILETNPSTKYDCSKDFTARLLKFTENNPDKLHGYRLIDHRNGNSIHSWELGIKGECNDLEIEFMNELIANRRKKKIWHAPRWEKLNLDEIKTFLTMKILQRLSIV